MAIVRSIMLLITFLALYQAGFAQSGGVGIGTNNPKAQLHTTGSVRFDTLKGMGRRPVYVNDSGVLVSRKVDTFSNNTPMTYSAGDCNGGTSSINVAGLTENRSGSRISVQLNFGGPVNSSLFVYLVSPTGKVLNIFYGGLLGTAPGSIPSPLVSSGSGNASPLWSSPDPVSNAPQLIVLGGGSSLAPISACSYGGTINSYAQFGDTLHNGTWTIKVIHGYPFIGWYNPVVTLDSWSIMFENMSMATGFGTDNPEAPVDIVSPDNTTNPILKVRANNLTQGVAIGYNRVSAIGSLPNVNLNLESKGAGSLILQPSGGNVGIGTFLPGCKLEVAGCIAAMNYFGDGSSLNNVVNTTSGQTIGGQKTFSEPVFIISQNNSTNDLFSVRSNNGAQGVGIASNKVAAIGNDPNVSLTLASQGTGHIIFDPAAGNVGIGTTTPAQKLTVAGTVSATDFLGNGSTLDNVVTTNTAQTISGVKNFSSGVTALTYSGDGGALTGVVKTTGDQTIMGLKVFSAPVVAPLFDGDGHLLQNVVHTNDNQTISGDKNFSSQVTVGGNMGIGTSFPVEKLDVAGVVRSTGYTLSGTGTYAANMVAASYGTVYSAGTSIAGGSNNCTVAHTAMGVYTITFSGSALSGQNLGNLPVIVSLFGSSPGVINWTDGPTVGTIKVYTFNMAGAATDRGFSFAVYKP